MDNASALRCVPLVAWPNFFVATYHSVSPQSRPKKKPHERSHLIQAPWCNCSLLGVFKHLMVVNWMVPDFQASLIDSLLKALQL